MQKPLRQTDNDILALYDRHVDTVYRVCFSFLHNRTDTEDMVQNVFLKLMSIDKTVESHEHEKAWLIVTASNMCKNSIKHWWRKNVRLEDYEGLKTNDMEQTDMTCLAILELPDKYKTVIYLYYYEGYQTGETAKILDKPASTVRNHLMEGRKILKKKLEGEANESLR